MHVEAGSLVRIATEQFGSRIALSAGTRTFSFGELNEKANRVGSALLARGIARGDRVGVLAYNTPEVAMAWFAFEKHNFVRTRRRMTMSQFRRIACVQQIDEADSLHYTPRRHIEAGDDALGQHRSTARKLRSTCSPASPDFSGWNCTPKRLPRSTAPLKGPA